MVRVTVQDLVKQYGKTTALRSVSLEFRPGALTAILGPSGCGKTTLLRSIAGFIRVDSGQVLFDSRDVTHLSPQERDTAMVFQNYALWPHMTIFENVAYGLRLRKLSQAEIERRVMAVMDMVEMRPIIGDEGIRKRRPSELSGGQQQRVALARALVVQPKVLLLDEPLSNLDAKVRQRVRVEIRRLQKRVGITTIHVTHDQEEALSIADEVVVMDQGVIVQVGTPEAIYRQPNSTFVAEFLGNSNVLTGLVQDGQMRIGETGLLDNMPSSGPATLIFRADEAVLMHKPLTAGSPVVALPGTVEEALFIGSTYRHLVRVAGHTVLVDTNERFTPGPAWVVIPREKLQIYVGGQRL